MEISIIVPIYNVEKYVRECLASILEQTFKDFELICVDDCSIDRSMEIVYEYQRLDSRVVVIKNIKNIGLSCSRNEGLKVARGKYILFVDSDDYLVPNALEILYREAETRQTDILYFNKKIIYDEEWSGPKENEYTEIVGCSNVYTGQELFEIFMQRWCFKSINAYTQFFKTHFIRQNQLFFYDSIVHEDFLFYFNCAMHAEKVSNLDIPLYVYRKRAQSITSNATEWNKMSIFIVLFEILNYWKNGKFTEEMDEAIHNFLVVVYRTYDVYNRSSAWRKPLSVGDKADRFLYQCMMKLKYVSFSKEEIERIKNATEIYIYGAGMVGHETAIVLENENIDISGFVVTQKEDRQQRIFGWNIYQLNELTINRESLFVVAVDINKRKELIDILMEAGYTNIICAVKTEDELCVSD